MLRIHEPGKDSSFLATLDKDDDGNFVEPLYITQGTPHGNLYERFSEFIKQEKYNVQSKPYEEGQ